jgi:hypothetical protein
MIRGALAKPMLLEKMLFRGSKLNDANQKSRPTLQAEGGARSVIADIFTQLFN